MQNEAFEAYQTMKDLEAAGSSDLEWEFMLLLLALLALLGLCVVLPALLVRRARARRAGFRSLESGSEPEAMLVGEFREVGIEGSDEAARVDADEGRKPTG